MRWIFYCLIVANFGFFIWQLQSVHNDPAGNGSGFFFQERLPDGDILVLLSERISTHPASHVPEAAPPSSITEKQPLPDPVEEIPTAVDKPPSAAGMRAVGPTPAPVPDKSVQRASASCYQVGPFADELDQQHAFNTLRTRGLESKATIVDKGIEKEHWVLIPPAGTRAEAVKALQTLKGLGVDSYLVTEGENRNAISLGLFVREASAIGVAERVASLGFETEVRIKEKPVSEYWIMLRTSEDPSVVLRLLEKRDEIQRDIKILDSGCEMFAH